MPKTDPKAYRHVLVVENEPPMRDLLARAVESAGFVVTTAANAADAKRAMKSIDPDAIVVDIELGPGPNGFELVESLNPSTPAVGIVYLTNLPDPRFGKKDVSMVKSNQAYLRKGAIQNGQELVDAIEAVLTDAITKEYRHDLASNRPFSALSSRQVETRQLLSEGKTNAIKHGKAKNIKVSITKDGQLVELIVENDGSEIVTGQQGLGSSVIAELTHSHRLYKTRDGVRFTAAIALGLQLEQ